MVLLTGRPSVSLDGGVRSSSSRRFFNGTYDVGVVLDFDRLRACSEDGRLAPLPGSTPVASGWMFWDRRRFVKASTCASNSATRSFCRLGGETMQSLRSR